MPSRAAHTVFLLLLAAALSRATAQAQGVNVSLRVIIESLGTTADKAGHHASMTMPEPVVAWLTPSGASDFAPRRAPRRTFVLSQKGKQFTPHLLVVPTGSSVEFPNFDPFFHNVFSLFNGRRFDLGLYEAGSRRSVRFDHDGVSYIFCNIHPEMGAVIVSLSTPFYSISSADGSLNLSNVPTGEYDLNLWSENVSLHESSATRRHIHVANEDLRIPLITLHGTSSSRLNHLNKFGETYKKTEPIAY